MKSEWKAFLVNKGAEIDNDRVSSFGNQVRETRVVHTGNVIADLSHHGLIAVHGEDAKTFLQGQLINNVLEVSAGCSQLNALCTPKGRVLADFRVFQKQDTLYLSLPAEMVDDVIKRLRMYVLRAKVTLEDVSNSFIGVGFSGPTTDKELASLGFPVPAELNQVTHTEEMSILKIPGFHPRYLLYGDLETMQQLWTKLDVHSAPVGYDPWQLLNIKVGVPVIVKQTSELFVPQMLNLHLLGAISFKKGCYTGQEVVARMQYLGKLKKRMYLANVDVNEKPQPGTKLYAKEFSETQSCGTVVNSAQGAEGGYDLLAVTDIKTHDQHTVHLERLDGPALVFSELPYPFDAETTEKIS